MLRTELLYKELADERSRYQVRLCLERLYASYLQREAILSVCVYVCTSFCIHTEW